MIELYITIFIAVFLIILSFLDLKYKAVPSVMTTGLILVCSLLYFNHLNFAIISFIFAWLLYEGDIFKGIADVKIGALLGFFCVSLLEVIQLLGLFLICIYTFKLVLWIFNKNKMTKEEIENVKIPMLPIISIIFITIMGLKLI